MHIVIVAAHCQGQSVEFRQGRSVELSELLIRTLVIQFLGDIGKNCFHLSNTYCSGPVLVVTQVDCI